MQVKAAAGKLALPPELFPKPIAITRSDAGRASYVMARRAAAELLDWMHRLRGTFGGLTFYERFEHAVVLILTALVVVGGVVTWHLTLAGARPDRADPGERRPPFAATARAAPASARGTPEGGRDIWTNTSPIAGRRRPDRQWRRHSQEKAPSEALHRGAL